MPSCMLNGSTSNALASTSHLHIYLLCFQCSITWIHRYILDTQICSCAYFGYRHIHIAPQVTFHSSHHLPQVPAGFQSLQFMNPALTFHICIIICICCHPTLLHHAHIQTLNILSTTELSSTTLARSFLLTFWNQLNQTVWWDISKKIPRFTLIIILEKQRKWLGLLTVSV